jgi:hypothetical protein
MAEATKTLSRIGARSGNPRTDDGEISGEESGNRSATCPSVRPEYSEPAMIYEATKAYLSEHRAELIDRAKIVRNLPLTTTRRNRGFFCAYVRLKRTTARPGALLLLRAHRRRWEKAREPLGVAAPAARLTLNAG